jgi:hypothetical protein
MTTQSDPKAITPDRSGSGEIVLGLAVLGCLTAGGVGIMMASSMDSGLDVLLCLLGSVTSIGMIFYTYLGPAWLPRRGSKP